MKQIHPIMEDNFKKINCPFYYFGECTEKGRKCDPRLCPPKKKELKIKEDNYEKEVQQAGCPSGHLRKMQKRYNRSYGYWQSKNCSLYFL